MLKTEDKSSIVGLRKFLCIHLIPDFSLILFLFLSFFSFHIDAKEAFTIKNYDVQIQLNANGSFDVTERIEVRFSEERHGIMREIPYKYLISDTGFGEKAMRQQKGKHYEILIKDVVVEGHKFKVFKEYAYLRIRIGDPRKTVKGKEVYVIKYTVWGGLNQFENHQEFSWNIIGNEWDTEIDKVNYNIQFPKPTPLSQKNVLVYTGASGAKETNATAKLSQTGVAGNTTKTLNNYEGMSIALRFPKTYFENTEVPVEAYADHFLIENHRTNVRVNPDASLDVEEYYDINFLYPTSSIGREFSLSPQSRSDGMLQYAMIDEADIYIETTPATSVKVKVDRKWEGDFMMVKSMNSPFSGRMTFEFHYKIWGAVMEKGNTAAIQWEFLNTLEDEPVRQSSFDLLFREKVQLDKNNVSMTLKSEWENDVLTYQIKPDGIAGKSHNPLLHGESYEINISTDATSFDFSKIPLEVFAQHYIVDHFKTDIFIEKDGSALVEYELDVNFIYRSSASRFEPYIQKKYDVYGDLDLPGWAFLSNTYCPLIFDIENPDEDNYEFTNRDGIQHLNLKDPNFGNWINPIKISYKVYGLLKKKNGKQQLHIPVFFALSDPVRAGTFTIHFPEEPNMKMVETEAVTSNGRVVQSVGKFGNEVSGTLDQYLRPDEALNLKIRFPDEVISESSFGKWFKLVMINNGTFVIAFLEIIVLWLLWYFIGRDEKHTLVVQFEPPKDITPAEAGLLWDGKLHKKDLVSLIYHWGANGHLKIRETGEDDDRSLTLIQLSPLPDNAKPFEKILFNRLFKHGNEVEVNSLRDNFYKTMRNAHKSLEQYGKQHHFYVPGTRGFGSCLMVFGGIIGVFALVMFGVGFVIKDFSVSLPLIFLTAGLLFFGYFMPKKAHFGAKKYAEILGFREFVYSAELDRLKVLVDENPKYFEQTIAYAIVFGLGKQWAQKFKELTLEPPDWYESDHGRFNTIYFTNNMISSMHKMNTDFNYRTPPQTSSGSGGSSFGGGFSSGGGFGGGGGSSW